MGGEMITLRLFADRSFSTIQSKVSQFARTSVIVKAFEPRKKDDMIWFCVECEDIK